MRRVSNRIGAAPSLVRRALLGWGARVGRTAAQDDVLAARADMNTRTECWLAETAEGRELIARFRASFDGLRAEVERAERSGDRDALRRIAHRLRGTAPNYGFAGLGRAAAATEEALLHDEPIEDRLADLFAALCGDMDRAE